MLLDSVEPFLFFGFSCSNPQIVCQGFLLKSALHAGVMACRCVWDGCAIVDLGFRWPKGANFEPFPDVIHHALAVFGDGAVPGSMSMVAMCLFCLIDVQVLTYCCGALNTSVCAVYECTSTLCAVQSVLACPGLARR